MDSKDFQNGIIIGLTSSLAKNSNKSLDYTVTFISEGEPYEIIQVKKDSKINAPVTEPISPNGLYYGWLYNDGSRVVFPYTPNSNINLFAGFSTVRREISSSTAGTFLCTAMGTKLNDGLCVCGWYYNSGLYYGRVIGQSKEAISTDKAPKASGSFQYNDKTWYYNQYQDSQTNFKDGLPPRQMNSNPNYFNKELLDYFFMVE